MADNIFKVEIITPDRVFYKGELDFIEFTSMSGELGVYKNHIPMTTVLAPGLVTIHNGEEEKVAAVHAGFAEILGDKVTLLAELAEWPDEIDVSRAESAKERAEEQLRQKQSIEEYHRSKASLARAMARLKAGSKDIPLGY